MAENTSDVAANREAPMSTSDLANAGQQPEPDAYVRTDGNQSGGAPPPLFPENEAGDLRQRWDAIQAGFVDEPRRAVEEADTLVAAAMKRLAEIFANERSQLEGQWDRGDKVSTEDLRIALQRYRAFFTRLLAV
ncbi:MAG: hypothetical protein JF593_08710 [Novosphingobium sp.]|nr:hypothetical protein [Novosphingobium sp.]